MKNFLRKLFSTPARQVAKPEPIIIVSGLPRSGTSMMMKMLETGGIPLLTDQVRTADEDNPQGYYEFERVKELEYGDTAWLADAQGKAVKIVSALLQYLPPNYHYKVIFMRRQVEEVLASQRKMKDRRGASVDELDDKAMAKVLHKHLKTVSHWLLEQPNLDLLYINYNTLLKNPVSEAAKVSRFLSHELDPTEMITVVDPTLYRNRKRREALPSNNNNL